MLKRFRFSFRPRKKSSYLLLFSLLLGLIVAMQINQIKEEAKQETEVVILKSDITLEPYSLLTKDMVELSAIPTKAVLPGTFSTLEEVVGKYSVTKILPGTPIRSGLLLQEQSSLSGVLRSLQDGKLIGISIPLDKNDIGAEIQPQDRIHLAGVFSIGNGQVMTKYVAENALVLAKDVAKDGSAKIYLAIRKEDFLDVTQSIETGRIRAGVVPQGVSQSSEVEEEKEPESNDLTPVESSESKEGQQGEFTQKTE